MRWKLLLTALVAASFSYVESGRGQFILQQPSCSQTLSAGTTPGQVNTAITNNADPVVLCFEAGSYTWGGGSRITLPVAKNTTLICKSTAACEVTFTLLVFDWPDSASSSKNYRISGFKFLNTQGGTLVYDPQASGSTDILTTSFRLDHNTFDFTGATTTAAMWQLSTSAGHSHIVYGVADHNTFIYDNAKGGPLFNFGTVYSAFTDTGLNSWGGSLGDSENFFIEDNVITIPDAADMDCSDATGLQGVVIRFNTSFNCRYVFHGTRNNFGPSNVEMYFNDMTFDSNWVYGPAGEHSLHMQGAGTNGVFGNRLTGVTSTVPILIQEYRSGQPGGPPATSGQGNPDCGGDSGGSPNATQLLNGNRSPESTYHWYPSFHQPGRDYTPISGFTEADYRNAFYPVFAFLNYKSNTGAISNMLVVGQGGDPNTPDYTDFHLVANRDVFNGVGMTANTCSSHGPNTGCSPFDGTTGIGHGPLNERPSTCTVASDSDVGEADEGRSGVMYWATDQGSWNKSAANPYGVQQGGRSGVLYMCTATDTWPVYYTPYTYPHPLQSR